MSAFNKTNAADNSLNRSACQPVNAPFRLVIDGPSQASENDRRWFERHAGRSYRLRWAIGEELDLIPPPPVGSRWVVVVRQAHPGVRVRLQVGSAVTLPLNAEPFAAQLFEAARGGCAALGALDQLAGEISASAHRTGNAP